jgi:Ca2+-transporting ATPase
MTMLILMLANLPILFPIQILWINLITDGLPALALGVDPAESDLMKRPPRKSEDGILNRKNLLLVFWQGLVLTVIAVSATLISYYVFKADAAQVRTVTFAALVLLQILHSFNFRVGNNFYFSKSLFRNQYLNGAFLVSIVLQVVVIFMRPINGVFKTAPLQINSILMLTILCIVGILIINTWNRLAGRKH